MKRNVLLKFFGLSLFIFLFGFIFPHSALAANYTLSGQVTNNSSNPVVGATVTVNDTSNDSTTTDSSGNYSLSIPQGTYNVSLTPVSGSGYSSAIALNQNISSNTVLNFVLTPSGTVTLSGHIYGSLGNSLPDQEIFLRSGSTQITAYTDSNGAYSLQATPGTYFLYEGADNSSSTGNDPSLNVPVQYYMTTSNFSLSQSMIMNITVPAKKVSVHVQDSSNNAIANAVVRAGVGAACNVSTNSLTLGITTGVAGTSCYGYFGGWPDVTTDSSGNATLWLLPTDSSHSYNLTAISPTGSSVLTTTVSNVSVTSDTSKTITMQSPVTLSGHIYNALGSAVSDQEVLLQAGGQNIITYTSSDGSYSLQAAPGTYLLFIGTDFNGDGTDPSQNLPQDYNFKKSNYSLTANTTLNVTLPLKKVSVHVQDAANNPISNATLKADVGGRCNISNNSLTSGSLSGVSGTTCYGDIHGSSGSWPDITTDSSGNATLWLFPTDSSHTYTMTATPPSGSNYTAVTLSSLTITSDTSETITMQQPVTLSGHVYDPLGNPIADQQVELQAGSQQVTTVTNTSGSYSVTASTGTYTLYVSTDLTSSTGNAPSLNVPQYYLLKSINYNLTGNTTLNITVPAKKVSVHVQDANNNPVSNIKLTAEIGGGCNVSSNSLIVGSLTNVSGTSCLGYFGGWAGFTTDSSGNATVWLLPTDSSHTYIIPATPPNGSIYNPFNLSSVSVTSDETELISLQYNHATPVTTAALSPTPFSDGTYADPTTVTLSASAAAGYTIANTYYTIDGGAKQTYTSPFTVTGAGNHTITYWSVDNSGVPEAANTKTFAITEAYSLTGTVYVDANQNGVQDTGEARYAGATVSLDNGQSTTTDSNGNYTFANLEAGTYVDTITIPNGYTATTTNPATVALAANTTQNFGIVQQQTNSLVTAINTGGDIQGNFTADTNFSGGTTYTSSATVDTSSVTNPAPQAVYQSVRYGNFTYTIPNLIANGTYTIRLHFNELYWGTPLAGNNGGVGSRVFNVSANGTQVLSNYDIYQQAGGANKAIVEQIPATADSNGNITLQFSTVTDNAMVNGIEVYTGALPSPSPTPTPTPASSVLINTGGNATGSFVSDADYSGGTTYTSTASVDASSVTNPAPQAVYQSVRYGNFSYTIPTYSPSTSYHVRLHFNELYWGTALAGNNGGTGSRVFNVSINGTQVLSNFDIYATAGGANKAVVEDFDTTTDANGRIHIQFNTVTDNAMVNGIEISKN